MRIRVLLFAAHRELVGRNVVELDVPDGATLDDLYGMVQEQQPRLAELRPYTAFAVNREIVSASSPLSPGDEVAFLQPVSGGGR